MRAWDEIARHVRQVGPDAWELDPAFVQRTLATIRRDELPVVMSEWRGVAGEIEPVAVRLLGVRRSLLCRALGLRSDDVVRTIDGMRIRDRASLARAYRRFRARDVVWVSLERGGRPRAHTYRVVDR